MSQDPDEIGRIPSRSEVIAEHRRRGGKVAAVFPIHYPRAMLEAFGLLPVEVWGPPAVQTQEADARLQAYACGIIRHGLSFLLQGGLAETDLLLVPHNCDSLQGLGSLLIDFVRPRQGVLTLYLPRGERIAGQEFLVAELRELFQRLSAITGLLPDPQALGEAVSRQQRADGMVRELFRRRRDLPWSDRELYRLIRSREYLPAQRFLELCQGALSRARAGARQGIPLVLSGVVPEPMALFDAISEGSGLVVGDDLVCVGRRLYAESPGAGDPFERLAAGLLTGGADFSRGCSLDERIESVTRLLQETKARGFLYLGMKFCEPEQFYLPALRDALHRQKIRTLFTEEELGAELSHQLLTRIQAFLESLS